MTLPCEDATSFACTGTLRANSTIQTGTVKFFNSTRGFGFISPDDGSKDVFVHVSAVERSGLGYLAEGQRLRFEVQRDPRGAKAVNLQAA
jgi:cold shock protein